MKNFRKILNKILATLAGLSFILMVLLVTWQVVTRYVFKNPSSWSEELVSYMFAWMTLLGTSLVVGERGHMNIPVVVEKFSHKIQKKMAIFGEVIAFLFSITILVYGGFYITKLTMGQMTSSLGVSMGIFYAVVPLCGILNMIYCILNIHDIVKGDIDVLPKEEV